MSMAAPACGVPCHRNLVSEYRHADQFGDGDVTAKVGRKKSSHVCRNKNLDEDRLPKQACCANSQDLGVWTFSAFILDHEI